MGDIVFQLISFSMMFGVVAGIVFLIVSMNKRSSKLDRVEKKVDQLLEKEKTHSDQ